MKQQINITPTRLLILSFSIFSFVSFSFSQSQEVPMQSEDWAIENRDARFEVHEGYPSMYFNDSG
ncbi:MAG: hypothetical protein AAFO91_19330, partial [Bacteroidota bacterium]